MLFSLPTVLSVLATVLASELAGSSTGRTPGHDAGALVPLTDLGAGLYLGVQGGLYPGGLNVPPAAHRIRAQIAAKSVVPRSASGAPDPDGLIGLVGVGMSNLAQGFGALELRLDHDPDRDARVVLVNAGVNGMSSDRVLDPNTIYWNVLDEHVAVSGLTPGQVQIVWIEQTRVERPDPGFPAHAERFRDDLRTIVGHLHDRFPNLRVAFLTTRMTGAYYTGANLIGEPYTYEEAFGVRWLIEEQINGDPALNADPLTGPVRAPVLLWGSYQWADGATPRADGLSWLPADLQPDGIHPSDSGECKLADLSERFLDGNAVARELLDPRDGAMLVTVDAAADATVDAAQPATPLGAGLLLEVRLAVLRAYLRFDLGALTGELVHAKLGVSADDRGAGVEPQVVSDTTWTEASITYANAPVPDGPIAGRLPLTSEDSSAGWDVTALVAPALGGPLAIALLGTGSTEISPFHSRETPRAPRLVLTVDTTPGGAAVFCPGRANGAGPGAEIGRTGSLSLAANDLVLHASALPPHTFGLFFYSAQAIELPLGDGLRCVGDPFVRLPPAAADGTGRLFLAPDLSAAAGSSVPIVAGETRYFQCWYRDGSLLGGSGFNVSSALALRFVP